MSTLSTFDDYVTALHSKDACSVDYTCACKEQKPLEELYYRSSGDGQFALACDACTDKIIDTYFCPACLNSFFSSSAFQNKNRCTQCSLCPSCNCTLTPYENGGAFKLKCGFCKWNSEDVGLSATSAAGLFEAIRNREDGSEAAAEYARLLTQYSSNHKQYLKERKEGGRQDIPDPVKHEKQGWHDVAAAMAKMEVDLAAKAEKMSALPKEAVNNDETAHSAGDGAASDCSLVQRLLNGDAAGGASSLWPTLTPLQTKLGRKAGDGFVIKPKAGANKVSFDKHNLALQALPLVTLGADTAALKAGETCKVLVMFANPLDKPVTLTFGDTASAAEAQAADEKRLQEEDEAGVMDEDEDAYPKVAAVATAAATCACTPPSVSVTVGKYDDIAEQNDLVKTAESALQDGDDAAVVGYRKLSKVGVFVEVTPAAGTEGEATCSFMVTVAVEGSSSTDDLPFNSTCVQVQLSLGKVA